MPRFKQTEEILKLMHKQEKVRNIGIIAHIDHGKTTMSDSLLAMAGLMAPERAGEARALDFLEEEASPSRRRTSASFTRRATISTSSTSSTPPATWTSPVR
jgi:translation elongation factor EF-Tu-like GTPase